MSRYNWVVSRATSSGIPSKAVLGGHDTDGDAIYVGRAKNANEYLPAKIIPAKNVAYVPYHGKAVLVEHIEYLCENEIRCRWLAASNGNTPPNAISTGKTVKGEPLYIGRMEMNGRYLPGKIHPSHECLYYALGGREHKTKEYEVLVTDTNWIYMRLTDQPPQIPEDAVEAGQNEDKSTNYVARARHAGDLMTATFTPTKNQAFVTYRGEAIEVKEIEVLCENTIECEWVFDDEYIIPPCALSSGETADGESLFIGRVTFNLSVIPGKIHPSHCCMYIAHGGKEHKIVEFDSLTYKKKAIWYSCSTDTKLPENACLAGHDIDNTPMFVGRAMFKDNLLPAKVMPKKEAVYVSLDGVEYRKKYFEVLCHGNFGWQTSGFGEVPPKAVAGGKTVEGETLYIGRVRHKKSVTVGKVVPSKHCLLIAFAGQEVDYQRYEILVTLD